MFSINSRLAIALGTATLAFSAPGSAQANTWKTVTGYPNCVMQFGSGPGSIDLVAKKNNAQNVSVRVSIDSSRQRKSMYRGSATFNGATSFVADEAFISEVFGKPATSLSFSNPDFIRAMKSKSTVTFRIGSESWGPYSLKGSSKVAADFMQCAGIAVEPVLAAQGNNNSTYDHKRAIGKGLNSDAIQMIDTAIYRDSRTWMFNRYNAGTVRDATITEAVGRYDYTVRAYYTYNRNRRGFVDVYFINGKIDCLRFHDNPMVCKPAG